jgi:hypothetical protein
LIPSAIEAATVANITLQTKKLEVLTESLSKLTVCLFMVAIATGGAALAQAIEPGEYITEKSWGKLTVKRGKGKDMDAAKLFFDIEAVGDNAHGCTLEGEIKGRRATLDGDDPKKPRIVTFAPGPGGIKVDATTKEACLFYCGVRATFEGEYLRAPAACRVDALEKSRAAARRAYDRKAFDEAKSTLESMLQGCGKFLGQLTEGWVRNDLAVTLHKLKDLAACRAVLKPLAEDAAMTDAQIRENYAPTDADNHLPIVRATRTNLLLCAAAKR